MSTETKCFECGKGILRPKAVDLTGSRNDEEFTVLVNGLQCSECGFKTIDNDQSGELTKAISDAYRQKHGLLTGAQIKAARLGLGMSQLQFARYLKVGPASVKRWENGQIQDEAMNDLILLKTDLARAIENCQTVRQKSVPKPDIVHALFGGEIIEFFVPSKPTQYRTIKSAFVQPQSKVTEVYAPLC